MKKLYTQRTDAEVKAAIKEICRTGKGEEQVRQRIKDELGFTGSIAITGTSTSSGGMIMWMFMVMLRGPSGNIIRV